jgi:protein involved in polysaccharide export with SLBB domain
MSFARIASAFFCISLLLGGCGGGIAPGAAVDTIASAGGEVPDYTLGTADKLRVIVFGEEALTGEFVVGSAGRVALPLIGEVQAAGLSISQFQALVVDKLKDGYINEPRVSIEVLNYRPFYILGEVGKPGEYPFTNRLNVLNAVATAGGFTYRADTRRVFIRRASQDKETEEPLTSTTSVAPGDTIRIAERVF